MGYSASSPPISALTCKGEGNSAAPTRSAYPSYYLLPEGGDINDSSAPSTGQLQNYILLESGVSKLVSPLLLLLSPYCRVLGGPGLLSSVHVPLHKLHLLCFRPFHPS